MMIPDRIKPYFLATDQRQDGENTLISGRLQCCGQPTFSLRTVGAVQRGLLHRMSLYPGVEGLALRAACARCERDNTQRLHSFVSGQIYYSYQQKDSLPNHYMKD